MRDDYDGEFHYQEHSPPSLQRLDRTQKVIYLGTFSKTLFPGLRLAYLVAPPALIPGLVAARQLMDSHTSLLSQAVTAEFISAGFFANHLRLMKILYAVRRNLLLELLEQAPVDALRIIPSKGGLQLAVEYLRGETNTVTLAAAQQGIILVELAPLNLMTPPINGWILGFAALTPQAIRQGMQIFIQILRDVTS